MRACFCLIVLCWSCVAWAGDVEILQVEFFQKGINTWQASATLKHADEGWKHYADAWRVMLPSGLVAGLRTLHHPHVDEQPVTRSLANIEIPPGVEKVTVEAHDKIHGWAKKQVQVDLMKASGDRYKVHRR